ncbi:methionyl-tRNA formyltransferase [Planctomycetota bacterium]
MKIVYLGSGEFGIDCLNALERSEHDLRLIITQPTQPAGRGKKPRPTPVARWAQDNSLLCLEAENVNATEVIEKITTLATELIVVIAFGQKVSNKVIEIPPNGTINIHSSLLPKYRGAAPINWAVINGEKETGISIITLAEKMDAGQILSQAKTEIAPNESAGQLHDRLAKLAVPLLLETIEKIADGSVTYTEQDHSKATLAPKLKKNDASLDFAETAESIANKIRGFWPWPGGWTGYLSKKTNNPVRVTLAQAEVIEHANPENLAPGTLDDNLNIICGQNCLKIIKIKPAGGSTMNFADFVNGRNVRPGDIFTKNDNTNAAH